MTNRNLLEEFKKLETDEEKWNWIANHQGTGIIVCLDNDSTYGVLPDTESDDDEDCLFFRFEDYIGCGDGDISLLTAFGINARQV